MKNNLLFLSLIFVYHFLFWQELPGLNLVLFGLAAIILHYVQNGFKSDDKLQFLFAGCYLLSIVGLLTLHSNASFLVFFLTFISYLGYLKFPQSSAWEAFFSGIYNFIGFGKRGLLPERIFPEGQKRPATILYTKLAIVPILILIIYVGVFSAGNSIFRDLNSSIFGRFFSFFENISWAHFFFILLGAAIVRWFFQKSDTSFFSLNKDSSLMRLRGKQTRHKLTMGLKHEYISALILFVLLNVLFAVVNFIDIRWVWFQFYVPAHFSLKEFVHDGVGFLILSLLMSMGLVLFYFRKNLNFYPNSALLKKLGYLWLIQNGILAISVVIRTSYYIDFHGLASKRIGLLVFLAMVFTGLVSLFIKIAFQKNGSFIIRVNSAFALILFSLCSVVNWDKMIAKVNLHHAVAHEIDVDNYLQLNPRVYPYLFENLDKIEMQINRHNNNEVRWIDYEDIESFKEALVHQSHKYLQEREAVSDFASWTWADAKTENALKAILN